MPRFVRSLKIPALLLLIAIAFNWKLVLSGQYTWLDDADRTNQVVPWLQSLAVQWHTGHFPLWNPHLWTGQPVVGMLQPGVLNPLNWILFSMPLKNGFIQLPVLHWYWVLIQFLGVWFGYLLCRDLGLSVMACVLGGCAFGLGGFMGSVGWPQVMMSAVLLPLILMFFLRVLRGERPLANAAASGALLGAAFLSGHHNVPTFFTVAMTLLWIYYFAAVAGPLHWKSMLPAAAFYVCFGLIAAAQVLPSQEVGKLSLRWVNGPSAITWNEKVPYSVHSEFSVRPTNLLGLLIPGFRQDAPAFIGLVVLTLALIGAAVRWDQRTVRVLSGVALGGLFFFLGGYSLFHGILYSIIPFLDKARVPNMATAIFQVGIIALAAYGLDTFHSGHANHWANRISIRLLCGLSLFIYAALVVMITVRAPKGDEYEFAALAAFAAIIFAGILVAWRTSRLSNRAAGALVILLLLFELNNVSNYTYQPIEMAAKLHQMDDIAAFVKQRPELSRVDVDSKEIPYNFGDWYGLDQLYGTPAALKSLADIAFTERFETLLANNYFIARNPSRPNQTVVFAGQSGLKVFSNPSAFPRARLVHAAEAFPDEGMVIAATMNPSADLRRTVMLQGAAPALENCDGGDVEVRRYRPTSVVVRTHSPCRSMLIFADAWFPGWKASVDGRPAEIYRAYNVVRGVMVNSGDHDVVMIYRPASVFAGAALAGLGIVLSVALQFIPDRKGQRAKSAHP